MCVLSKACPDCSNSYFEENPLTNVLKCTNCSFTKKRVTRNDNAFMVTATSDFIYESPLILTKTGWVDMVGCDTKSIYHKRQGKTLKYFINNPPYGYTVKIDML